MQGNKLGDPKRDSREEEKGVAGKLQGGPGVGELTKSRE